MRLPIAAFVLAVVLALGACGPKYEYPSSFKSSFMDNCLQTSGDKRSYCECALGYLQDNVPYTDALSGEGMSDAVDACAGKA
jgi:hypothetical protein